MQVDQFIAQFEEIKNPILGVRLPVLYIEERDKKEFNLSNDCQNSEFLRALCLKGFKKLNLKKDSKEYNEYAQRIKHELQIINEVGFTDYILLVWDVVNFCLKNNIPTGSGRGSAAGSLVLFIIGVTKIDPIKYNLYFERFISKTRAKKKVINGITYLDGSLLADVDIDFCFYKRKFIIEYLNNKYKGKVSKILTLNTLSSKLLIKEVGKCLGMKSEEEMTSITNLIPKLHGQVQDINSTYEKVPDFKEWCDNNPLIYETAKKIKDLNKNFGVHPSGVLISFEDLEDCCPTQLTSDKEMVSGYDMNWVSSFAVKLDVLGLRNVSVIADCCQTLGIAPGDIDIHDSIIYQNTFDLKYPHGLFQLETESGFRICKKVKPKNLNELCAIMALNRPGAMQFVDKYANYTNTGTFESIHPFFDNVLKDTGGLCLYQEQAMKMANEIGFTLDESEQIRRCITGDTLFISKTRGYISIMSLLKEGYKDDLFLVMDIHGNQSWQKINNIWSNGFKQTRYVESDNGMEVRTSIYHQFLTDSGWKARLKLNKKDYLISPKIVNWDGNDYISDDFAMVIAGIVTEGYFSGYNSTTFTNFDKEIMSTFCNAFFKVFGEEPSYRPDNHVVGIKRKQTVEINKYLPYGLSASKCLPEKMMGMTKETTRKFLSFILACEGGISQSNINTQRWFEFSSKNKKFAQQIQLLLVRFGIYSKLRVSHNKKYGNFYKILIKEYQELVKLNSELIVSWPSIKQKQLSNVISTPRVLNNSYDLIPHSYLKKIIDQYPFIMNQESGRLYSRPVNRETYKRLCLKTKDKKWIETSLNTTLFFNKFSNQNRNTREVEVFDFTIENPSTPFIIANGLVIHNCIGKKKIEEIKTWEKKIEDKVKEKNLPKEIKDVFWKIVEDSGGYQFNKSHSLAYSALCAQTAYLKFKYPHHFFLSLLKMAKNEPDSIHQISVISKEMFVFGIKLLPPNLSQMDFAIEGNDIRFGLSCTKGIGEKVIDKIKDFKKVFENKYEIFESAKSAGLSIGIVSALIQAGTLDSMTTNRVRLVYEAQLWNLLTDKEKKFVKNYAKDYEDSVSKTIKALVEVIKDEKSKPIIKPSRLETIKKRSEKYRLIFQQNMVCKDFANWWYENRLLGYTNGKTLMDIFIKNFKTLEPLSIIKTYEDRQRCDFVGIVDESKTGKSKNGNAYAKFLVSDETGTIGCMIFTERMERCKELNLRLPKEGDIVIVQGTKKEENMFFADGIAIQQNVIYTKLADLKSSKDEITTI